MEGIADHTDKFDREVEKLADMPFSRTIEQSLKRSPGQLATAALVTADNLRLAWYGAQHAFGKAAKPEHAFQLFDRMVQTLDKMPAVEADPEFYQMVKETEGRWQAEEQSEEQARRDALGAPKQVAPPPPPPYFQPERLITQKQTGNNPA